MEDTDKRAYELLAKLLHETKITPLFLDIVEGFAHAAISKNPAHKGQQQIESRTSNSATSFKSYAFYKAQMLLPGLGDTWMTAMDERFRSEQGITMAALTYDHAHINPDLGRLSPEMELNDAIVNGYLILVRQAFDNSKRYCLATTRLLTPNMCHGPDDRIVNIETLRKHEGIIIPMNRARHWTFAVLQYVRGTISLSYYDSLVSSASPVPVSLLEWIKFHFSVTDINIGSTWGPQQCLKNDCGVMMLIGMRLIAAGKRHLSQDEADEIIPMCRHRILAELLASQLDPKPEDCRLFMEWEQKSIKTDHSIVSFEDIPGRFTHMGISIENAILVNDSPAETPIGSTGNGETFMGATILSEMESPMSSFIGTPLLLQREQFPEFRDQEELAVTIEEEIIFGSPEPPPAPPSPKARTMKRKDPEPEEGVLEAGYTTANDSKMVLCIEAIPTQEKPERYEKALAYALSFAEEKTMIEALRQAVQAKRITQNTKGGSQQNSLAKLWSSLEAEDAKPRVLQSRYNRQQFSQQFLARQTVLQAQVDRKRAQLILKKEVGIETYGAKGQKTWRAANLQVTRASIWTELSDIFSEILGNNRFVALCAAPEPTTTMESMNIPQRRVFLNCIRRRLDDAKDDMVIRLKAAGPLCSALIEGELPSEPLHIEAWQTEWPLLRMESFEEIVSFRIAPSRRALPARS